MKKYLCISATHYNLLLFFLLTDFLDKSVFMVAPELMRESENFFCYSTNKNEKIQNKENEKIFKEIQKNFFKDSKCEIYAQDHIFKSYSFLKDKFYLIEDGLMTYTRADEKISSYLKHSIITKIRWAIRGQIPIHGTSKKVKKVFLRGLIPTPKCLEQKVEYIDIFDMWNKKSSEEKEYINNYFNFSKENIDKFKDKATVLFTQPLSEDKIISENEKIEIYKDILKNVDKNKLIIKIHPREKTDYKKIFPNVEIIEDKIPFELYLLNGFKCDEAITLFSTAVYSLEKSKITFYGTKNYPELLNFFGNIEYER